MRAVALPALRLLRTPPALHPSLSTLPLTAPFVCAPPRAAKNITFGTKSRRAVLQMETSEGERRRTWHLLPTGIVNRVSLWGALGHFDGWQGA